MSRHSRNAVGPEPSAPSEDLRNLKLLWHRGFSRSSCFCEHLEQLLHLPSSVLQQGEHFFYSAQPGLRFSHNLCRSWQIRKMSTFTSSILVVRIVWHAKIISNTLVMSTAGFATTEEGPPYFPGVSFVLSVPFIQFRHQFWNLPKWGHQYLL